MSAYTCKNCDPRNIPRHSGFGTSTIQIYVRAPRYIRTSELSQRRERDLNLDRHEDFDEIFWNKKNGSHLPSTESDHLVYSLDFRETDRWDQSGAWAKLDGNQNDENTGIKTTEFKNLKEENKESNQRDTAVSSVIQKVFLGHPIKQ